MTRFARAKGSKASNLKTPEDSTPWEVMKEHMLKAKQESEECKKREEAEQQRIENYNNFLKEHKVQKRKATWCDFPEVQHKKTNTNQTEKEIKKKNKTVHTNVSTNDSSNKEQSLVDEKQQKKKKKKKIIEENTNEAKSSVDFSTESKGNSLPSTKKKKNKSLKSPELQLDNNPNVDSTNNETNITTNSSGNVLKNKKNKLKKKKNQIKEGLNVVEDNTDKTTNNQGDETKKDNIDKKTINKKKNKFKSNEKPDRRKPVNDRSFQLIINSKEVELVRYDGFPIMKRDAERLDELKKNMIKKGIPKSEVQRTMKLERRRAEKALARLKRDVCYNCRKGGHNLSDCPDLKSNLPGVDAAEGLCFKCGSTEHRQFECKVQKDKEFRFATCFICKQSGHIARQCPDNPKGLYPNGGCCKLCGDVTHLRKDCPTVKDKKEETSIKLQSVYDDNIEEIDQKTKSEPQEIVKKPKKIKF